jgi:tetratricopeptide (TPR) repeat protein
MSRRPNLAFALMALAALPAAAQDTGLRSAAEVLLDARMPARDDADALAAALLEAAADQARSPVAELLVAMLGRILPEARDPQPIVAGLRTLLAREDLHGAARHEVEARLQETLRILGDEAAAAALDPFAGFASRWLAVGPFGDSGDFYDGEVFAPEVRFPAPGTELQGRFGKVLPRVVERRPRSDGVALGEGAPRPAGCHYGLHQVRLGEPLAGYLRLDASGAVEVFVDGTLLRRVDRLRERRGRVVHLPFALGAGIHHVLVKTTFAERDDVALAYVDARGLPLRAVEELPPDRVHEPSAPGAAPPPTPAPYVDALDALARAAARDPALDQLDLATALFAFDGGATDLGNELLFALAQAPPTATRERLALAEVWRVAGDVPAEIRDGEARRGIESVAEELDGHHFVTMRRADLLRGDDRIEDAIHLCREALEQGRGGPQTYDKLVDLLDALGARAEAENARRAWLAAFPRDVRPRRALAQGRANGGDPAGAFAWIEAGLALLPGHRGLLTDARALAVDLGMRERALALLDARDAEERDRLAALRDRARTLRELGDTAAATAVWRRCADMREAGPGDLRELGLALWRAGDRDAAREILRRSIAGDPTQHDLRRLLGRDQGGIDLPRIASFRSSAEEIDAMVRGFAATEREAQAPSTLVLDRMVVEFTEDGGHVQEVHQLRRINDLSGVEAHEEADAAARADELVRLRTIGVDGESYVPKRVGGTFAMPRLEPGAFVEELWRERFDEPGAEPWRGPSFLFRGESEAFLLSELVLILPPGHRGTVRTRGFQGEPVRTELDAGYTALRFTRRDVPRLRPERLTPPLEELVPVATYGEDRSPGPRTRMTRAGADVRSRVTPWVRAATAAVVAELEGDTARARAIHTFVHDSIAVERGSPDPTATLLRRQGPRFFLEIAMLKAAGIPVLSAAVAATSEEQADEAPSLFAGETGFDIPAARIEPRDGGPLWLFADLPRHAPLGLIPAGRAGAAALLADEGQMVRLPAATEVAPGWRVQGRIELTADGEALFEVRLELRDEPGYGLAQQVRDLDANRRQLVGRGIGAQLFEGWTVVAAELLPPEPGQRFAASLQLRRRGALQPAGDLWQLALPLPATDAFRRYGDQGPRELPLRLTGRTLEVWDVVVVPAPGSRFAGVPSALRLTEQMLDYELVFTPADGGLRVHRRIAIRPGTLPVGRFGEWIHALQRIDRAEDTRLEIVGGG